MRYFSSLPLVLLSLMGVAHAQFGGFFDQMFGGGGGGGHHGHQQRQQNVPSDSSGYRQIYDQCEFLIPWPEVRREPSGLHGPQRTARTTSVPTHWPACTFPTTAPAPGRPTKISSRLET